MQPNQNNQMNPSDNRNLVIFMILSALLYLGYDTYISRPHQEAARAARIQAAQEQKVKAAENPTKALLTQAEQSKDVQELLTQSDQLDIENTKLSGSLALKGARLNYIQLNDYFETMKKEEKVTLLAPQGSEHARTIEYGWVSADPAVLLPSNKTLWTIKGTNTKLTPQTPITLLWNNGQGLRFERTLSLDDKYVITVDQKVINNTGQNITLYPYGLISQRGVSRHFQGRTISHEGPIAYVGKELEKPSYKDMQKKKSMDFESTTGWTGITDKYWLNVLMPPQGQDVTYRFSYTGTPPSKKQKDTGHYQADFTGSALTLAPGQSGAVESHIFTGPKRVLLLKDYSEKLGVAKLDLAIDFGMFWFLTIPFFYALHYLGMITGNMGLAIIALTILIRTAASPLTYSSYKSFAKMKKVMPQVNELKEKYGDDKEKMQQEMLKLYQHEGVNPAAGCFPIILQIPIFFALYKILFISIELRHQPFYGWIQDLSAADPTNVFNAFGLIPWDPPSFLHVGIWPCFMLVAMQIQRSLSPPPTDTLQRDMMRFFPIVMTFIMAKFASGLVIYWTISAFFGNLQQIIIMRKMGVPIHLFGESHDEEDKAKEAKAEITEKPAKKAEYEAIKDISPPKPKRKKKK